MPKIGFESVGMPKLCRKSLDMSLGPRPGINTMELTRDEEDIITVYKLCAQI